MSGLPWDSEAIEGALESLETYLLEHIEPMIHHKGWVSLAWDARNDEVIAQEGHLRALLALLPEVEAALVLAHAHCHDQVGVADWAEDGEQRRAAAERAFEAFLPFYTARLAKGESDG